MFFYVFKMAVANAFLCENGITVKDLLLFSRNKIFWGWTQSDNTKTTILRYHFMFFYVSKLAVAIAFLCKNAGEAI